MIPLKFFILCQISFCDADEESQQQGIEQDDRSRLTVFAREDQYDRQSHHESHGHTVRPPGQVRQVAVKDDRSGKKILEEGRQAGAEREFWAIIGMMSRAPATAPVIRASVK